MEFCPFVRTASPPFVACFDCLSPAMKISFLKWSLSILPIRPIETDSICPVSERQWRPAQKSGRASETPKRNRPRSPPITVASASHYIRIRVTNTNNALEYPDASRLKQDLKVSFE